MKLVRFSHNGATPRLGALEGDRVVDLQASLAATLARPRRGARPGDRGRPRAPEHARLPGGRGRLRRRRWPRSPSGSPTRPRPCGCTRPSRIPGKFICIGLNYRDHAEETNNPIPKEPPIFPKWSTAIVDPGEPVLRPRGSTQLDWEVELGVVIGRTARFVTRENALDYVWGYTIINDISARDFQFLTSQWAAGKIADTFAPVGPYIADRREIPDPHVLDLKTFVNGKQMQRGTTRTFIFNVNYLVSYLSGLMTLSPGDLIATGTPPGVGAAMKPPVFMHPGDVVRVEITGLGSIENPIKDA